jgi:hypothetical protein
MVHDDPGQLRTWAGYRAALSQMKRQELLDHLTGINAALQAQSQAVLERQLRSLQTSGSSSSIDNPVVRSTPPERRSNERPMDRGAYPSRLASPQPSALDLLARSKSLAPRIAAKLVLSEARRRRSPAKE